jgi:hypothetical protein
MTTESTTGALEQIYTWRERLSDQTVVSASEVQNRLFDLYGDLQPFPQLEKIKPWLSLTIERELFSASELEQFLGELQSELGETVEAKIDADLGDLELELADLQLADLDLGDPELEEPATND